MDKLTYKISRIVESFVGTVAFLGSDSTAKPAVPHLGDGAIKLGLPGLPVNVGGVVQSWHLNR